MKFFQKLALTSFYLLLVPTSNILLASEEAGALQFTEQTWWNFGYQIVNFLLLVYFVHFFAKKPFNDFISSSAQTSKKVLEKARNEAEAMEKKLGEYEKKIAGLDKVVQDVRQKAEEETEEEKQKMIREAQAVAEQVKKQAEWQINRNVELAKDEIKKYLLSESTKLAEKILSEKIADKQQKAILDRYSNFFDKQS